MCGLQVYLPSKCYPKVVTKCISKANYETDPDEEKINHRIPHRFEGFSNLSANWCCHCGYLLPFGRKNAKRCTECGLTSHTHCTHLVPDFCGISMEAANQILETLIRAKNHKKSTFVSSSLSNLTNDFSTSCSPPIAPEVIFRARDLGRCSGNWLV
ncbi:hypothetical protein PENPOL_c041G00480 [Penicillium polonicum]|uniref:Phorbol-ester/DAG-type domain-containing protein n=1 Tax=Penicillium polonicum TaxID=60169 RepID=A0A1V6N5S8_PENPO|nr:hypothetical protein PENPOL_c041G00480 [Penicillium polonicum]